MYKIDNFRIFEYAEYKHIGKTDFVQGKGTKKRVYCATPMFLDTETSKKTKFIYNKQKKAFEEKPYISWIYQWALCVDSNTVVIGRKPKDLVKLIKDISEKNLETYTNSYTENALKYRYKKRDKERKAPDSYKTMIYVHNLSFDWSYLHPYLSQEFGDVDYLATSPHKVFTVSYPKGHIEFRCSYKLTNKSLAKWGVDLGVKHAKMSGAIDYNIVRYQDSELTETDWLYQIYDVIAMQEAFTETVKRDGDTLLSIPYTSTGYIRRRIRDNFKDPKYRKEHDFVERYNKLNPKQYNILNDSFAGAISTQNFYYLNQVVEGDMRHRDFTSHYPTQQICKLFPIGKLEMYYDMETDGFIETDIYDDILNDKENATFFRIVFNNLTLKKEVSIPYLSESKLHSIEGKAIFHSENGRVLKVDGSVEYCGTNLDLKWIEKQYKFDYIITEIQKSKLGKLPNYLLDVVKEAFYGKSYFKQELKRCENEYGINSDEAFEASYNLMKSKNLLNGIYGCTATNPLRPQIIMSGSEWKVDKQYLTDNIEDLLKDYNKHMFLPFQWGVWTTALGRDELMTCVADVIGYENVLYCDTDSAFYLSTPEIEERVNKLNKEWRDEAEENGYFVEVNGKKVYFHYFDEEEPLRKFKVLHSKCYAMEVFNPKTNDYELSATIAGVKAKTEKWIDGKLVKYDRNTELGCVENLKTGFVFTNTGSSGCEYINVDWVEEYCEDGHIIDTCNGAVIVPQTQTLKAETVDYEWTKVNLSDE